MTRQYGVSQLYVDSVSLIYMVVFVLFNFQADWLLDQVSFRGGILLGAWLTAIGALVRVGINRGLWLVLLGQGLLSLAQPLILNSCTKVAWQWFTEPNVQSLPAASGHRPAHHLQYCRHRHRLRAALPHRRRAGS